MGYSFLEFMKRIGIFIVCAQSFLHFSAGKAYEKYIKLLMGIMILAQFTAPLRAVLLDAEGELWEEVERFQTELEAAAGNIVWDYEEENEAAKALEKEVEAKLEPVAGEYGFAVREVKVYGNPPKVEVAVYKEEKKEGRIQVEKIKVGNRIETEEEETGNHAWKYHEMREKFGFALNTDEAYIVIREE